MRKETAFVLAALNDTVFAFVAHPQQITVNVSTFLSENGYIRQEVAASLKKLSSQNYDVFFLALCTSVEVRVSAHRIHGIFSFTTSILK